jgi:hypothetical protein
MSSNNKVAKRAFTIDPRRRRVRNGIGARKFKPTEVYAEFIESNINMKNLKLSSSARSMRAARLVAAALRFAQRPAAVVAVAAKTANMIVNLCSSEEKSEESVRIYKIVYDFNLYNKKIQTPAYIYTRDRSVECARTYAYLHACARARLVVQIDFSVPFMLVSLTDVFVVQIGFIYFARRSKSLGRKWRTLRAGRYRRVRVRPRRRRRRRRRRRATVE